MIISRRYLLSTLSGGALAATASSLAAKASAASCGVALPEETEGPFPADGSRMGRPPGMDGLPGAPASSRPTPNALKLPFIRRADLRKSGTTGHEAKGVPLSLRILVTGAGCQPLSGHAVYIWHCTQDGDYSLYSLPEEDFLRGVQISDSAGFVTFHTLFPGCYDGRMPHIHVEVYASAEMAIDAANKLATTQFAFDPAICEQVYSEAAGYEKSLPNLRRISFGTDNVFSDNSAAELAAQTVHLSGNATDGFAGTVTLALGDGEREPARMGPAGRGGPHGMGPEGTGPGNRNGPPPGPPPSFGSRNRK